MRKFTVMLTLIAVGTTWIAGCNQTTAPDEVSKWQSPAIMVVDGRVSATSEIHHLLVATLQGRVIREFDDAETISLIASFLSETEQARLARRGVVRVETADDLAVLSVLAGLDPATIEAGALIAPYSSATWGRVKCCYSNKSGSEKCCPKKRKEG